MPEDRHEAYSKSTSGVVVRSKGTLPGSGKYHVAEHTRIYTYAEAEKKKEKEKQRRPALPKATGGTAQFGEAVRGRTSWEGRRLPPVNYSASQPHLHRITGHTGTLSLTVKPCPEHQWPVLQGLETLERGVPWLVNFGQNPQKVAEKESMGPGPSILDKITWTFRPIWEEEWVPAGSVSVGREGSARAAQNI